MLQTQKSLFEWWHSSEELVKFGFTKSEINQAFKTAKTKLSDITDDHNYTEANKNTAWLDSEYYEIINENTSHYFTEIKYIKGEEWKREYTANAIQYRSRSQYNTFDSDILKALLNKKFSYFSMFKWDIYQMSAEAANWEIYLKTEFGSVYVPVMALLKNNVGKIINRMESYHNDYRNHRDPKATKHNHKKDEHPQHCPLCQQRFYDESMKPLQSKEFAALKKELIK